jgi:hypothetical protein
LIPGPAWPGRRGIEAGYATLVEAPPAHVETVRRLVIDSLTKQQLNQVGRVSETILTELNASQ